MPAGITGALGLPTDRNLPTPTAPKTPQQIAQLAKTGTAKLGNARKGSFVGLRASQPGQYQIPGVPPIMAQPAMQQPLTTTPPLPTVPPVTQTVTNPATHLPGWDGSLAGLAAIIAGRKTW